MAQDLEQTDGEKPVSGQRWLSSNLTLVGQAIGFIILLGLLALRIHDPSVVQSVRLQGFDFLQQLKPREAKKLPVAIIDLDERSFRQYGQWPWPRNRIANLIDGLAARGAVAVGFDVVFSEYDRLSPSRVADDNPVLSGVIRDTLNNLPDNETVMAEAMGRFRVVVGQTSVRQDRDISAAREIRKIPQPALLGADPVPYLVKFPALLENVEPLEEAASGWGVFSVDPDPDGIFRRFPLVMMFDSQYRLALSAEVLRVATGGNTAAIRANANGIETLVIGGNAIPTDRNGKVWPWFTPSDPSKYISAASILDGSVDPGRISGHMILVGTSAVGLEDYRPTPLGVQVPGVEIHAQVIENILGKTMLKRPSRTILAELGITLVVGLLILLILPKLGAIWSFIAGGISVALILSSTGWAFITHRLLLDATFPIAATTALFILAASANYVREELQKQQIRGAFGQYLSPALVAQLSDNPDRLVLGGETRELSVLFTDVRGFTAISESYKEYPQGLTRLMNRFLTILSRPILERNGTIDKYMGDAIMAFWNAPVDDEDHAYKASMAALDMISSVAEFNTLRAEELKDSDEPYNLINVGIGINTGPCVVGNMGSDIRFDYTALGDTVNLASRLEGQSKPYGLPIVIGEATANVVSDRLATFEIDLIRVKGKNEPARIYCLAGDEAYASTENFKAFRALNASMLSSYRNRDWTSAYEALELMEQQGGKLGLTLEDYIFIYETRISEFQTNPPGASWDGVYTALSK